MPKVLNKRTHGIPINAIYVGRPTKWGNPFSHIPNSVAKFKVSSREEAIVRYREWIFEQPGLLAQLNELKDKDLVCWCAPLPCHADVLIDLANTMKHSTTNCIDRFDNEYRFLSNFYHATVEYEGKIYPTSEHAFQAAKTFDPKEREVICKANTPTISKKLGRIVKLRKDWDDIKYNVMLEIVRDKFNRNPDLAEKLIATGDAELIEGNTWGDQIWGVYKGNGKNWLGKILMQVRDEFKENNKTMGRNT